MAQTAPTTLWFNILLCLYKGGLSPKDLCHKLQDIFDNAKNTGNVSNECLRLMREGYVYATLTPDKNYHLTDEGKTMVVKYLRQIRSAYDSN